MDKVHNIDQAVSDISEGSTIAIGGFFSAGTPIQLVHALARHGAKNLTIICQSVGPGNEAISQLVQNGQLKKTICTYPFYRSASKGVSHPFEKAVRAGEIAVEVFPMGTFVKKLRAGGAGIAGFYTATGVGTVVERGKKKKGVRRSGLPLGNGVKTGLCLRIRLQRRQDGQFGISQDGQKL